MDLRLGIGGIKVVGRGIRFEGNLRVREVRVFLDARAWYIVPSGFVSSSQLEKLSKTYKDRIAHQNT